MISLDDLRRLIQYNKYDETQNCDIDEVLLLCAEYIDDPAISFAIGQHVEKYYATLKDYKALEDSKK